MRQYNDALDALRFSEEEQAMLTKKLERAAQAAQRPRKRRHPRRVMCIAAAVAILCSTTAFALKNNWIHLLYPSTDPTLVEPMVQPVENSIHKDGMTFTVEAMMGDRYNVLLVYTLCRDDGQPLATDSDLEYWVCIDNCSLAQYPDAYWGGGGQILDDDPSDGTIQFVSSYYAYKLDPYTPIPLLGESVHFDSIDILYETPNPDFVMYGEEARSISHSVFSCETDFDVPLQYTDMTIEYAAGQTIQSGDMQTELTQILLSPIGCTIQGQRSLLTDTLSEQYQTSFQLKLKNGAIWDGKLSRSNNGYLEAGTLKQYVDRDCTFNCWLFDRIIPTEDVQAIIFDGVEISLERIS